MATSPRTPPKRQKANVPLPERLTPLERAIDRSTIDVAACIRWTLLGIAAIIGAINAGPLATLARMSTVAAYQKYVSVDEPLAIKAASRR